MRQWECGSVCPCAPICFFYFLPNPGACRGTYAAQEGRTLHAATSPFTGIRQCAPMAKELTVERHYTRLPERLGAGKNVRRPPVMEAEAVAAMTCPGAIPLKTAVGQ